MAKRVSQVKLWKRIANMIGDEFDTKVYSDEVREDFEKPCFFIKSLMHSQLQNKFYIKRNLSIICTYFPNFDVDDIHGDRIGEHDDIMQFIIELSYMDTTGVLEEKAENGESMDTVQVRYEVEFEEGRKWQN